MAKNTQPVLKRCRTLGISPAVMGYSKTSNKNPGGQRRAKKSEYAMQLTEKQKVKFVYGVLEKQFRTYYEKAARMEGNTGVELLTLLERRLDNVVYRLGIAPTRAAARQLVSHRHICVNGNVVNIPSYSLRAGDVVSVREKSKSLEVIADSLAGAAKSRYAWLEWDGASMSGKFLQKPEREEIPENIKEQLIVELYSK